MKNIRSISGFVRTAWLGVIFILSLGGSLLIRFANLWIKSDRMVTVANVLSAAPVLLMLLGIVVFAIARPFIDRRIEQEMNTDEENQD